MYTPALKPIHGPSLLAAVRGLRQTDFLTYIGQQWQTYGDIFQLRLGWRTLIFAMHPDAVRQINITHRQDYDKRRSYDSVRRFIVGRVSLPVPATFGGGSWHFLKLIKSQNQTRLIFLIHV